MLDKEKIIEIYIKNKSYFIDSYISEIKARYHNFKKFNAIEKYNEALSLWENIKYNNEAANEIQIIDAIEKTKLLTHIEPSESLKIKNNTEAINKIITKFNNKNHNIG